LDQEDLDNPVLKTTSEIFLSSTAEGADLRTVDPETQARLEALLEAAGTFNLSIYLFIYFHLCKVYISL
jgi:ankyrin repeat domain-containing protein 17